jgi:hypothetical protein
MKDLYKTTFHRDRTVTYWSVTDQVWKREHVTDILDATLATLP